MARQLKPCGTYAAYARHLRNGEKPCGPCAEANRERSYAAPSGFNAYERQMEAALNANPPKITWRKGKDGIFRATAVRDPHAETKAQREWDERISREQVALLAMQEEADAAAERLRKHRADNTPLMSAARSEI